MKGLRVTEAEDGCTFGVHVVPRSRRDTVVGLYGEALKVRLAAPPVEGKANRALRVFLAGRLGVTVGAVEIISGHASRHKIVHVTGVQTAQVHALLSDEHR
ncbi:MAG TPA: YggU family protein [Chloroflexi bacterium]|nr:YggU family protein [Chloroflexota bacterium]